MRFLSQRLLPLLFAPCYSQTLGTVTGEARDSSGHESRRLEIVGVVANNDTERQLSNLEDRNLAASLIDRPIDGGIQLAIQADDGPPVKDRRGSNYCRDGVACEGRGQDGLRAAENCDALRLTPL